MYFEPDIFKMLIFNKIPEPRTIQREKACPLCSMTFEKIAHNCKVGCAECYKTFREQFAPGLMKIHGGQKHTGKIPRILRSQISAERKIEELQGKMAKLAGEQKFEEAALIRDEIKVVQRQAEEKTHG